MRALYRNKQTIYYALYEGKTPIIDEYGNETGEYDLKYSTPVAFDMNVSAARGASATHAFGENENFDKTLITDNLSSEITGTSIFWIDTDPVVIAGIPTTPHDYIVKQVAKSLNSVTIAVSKVKVS